MKTHKIKNGTKIISYVGRFSKENYIYDYIEILKRLLTKYPDILLIMAGDMGETKYIKKNLEKNKILKSKIIPFRFCKSKRYTDNKEIILYKSFLMGGFSLIGSLRIGSPSYFL